MNMEVPARSSSFQYLHLLHQQQHSQNQQQRQQRQRTSQHQDSYWGDVFAVGGGDASASGSYLSSSLSVDGEGKGDRSAVPGSNIHIHGTPSSDSEVLTDANPNFKAHVGAEILQTPPQTHTLTQTETGAAAGMGAVAEADSNANSSLNSNTNATTRMIANNDVDLTSGLDYDYVLSLEDVNRGNNGGFTKGKLGRQRSVKEGRRFLDLGGRLTHRQTASTGSGAITRRRTTSSRTQAHTPKSLVLPSDFCLALASATSSPQDGPIAVTHSLKHEGPQRARTISYPRLGITSHRPTRSCTNLNLNLSTTSLGVPPVPKKPEYDKPLPPPPASPLPYESKEEEEFQSEEKVDEMGMSVKRRSSRVLEEDEDTLRGSRLVSAAAAAASVSVSVRASRAPAAAGATDTPRADVSFGSWLAEGGFEVDEEHNDIRHIDGFLPRSSPSSVSLISTTPPKRPQRHPRSSSASKLQHTPFASRSIDHLRQDDFFGSSHTLPSLQAAKHKELTRSRSHVNMAVYNNPHPIHTDPLPFAAHAKAPSPSATRPGSEAVDPSTFDSSSISTPSAPKIDPSNFPDPYPNGMSMTYHNAMATTPALSSAGSSSASTRSSAYTNAGSTISASGFSGDYSHVRVASGDEFDGHSTLSGVQGRLSLGASAYSIINSSGCPPGVGYGTDSVSDMPTRASTGSSLSSGSGWRRSQGHTHASATMPARAMRQANRPPRAAHAPSQSQPDDLGLLPVTHERPAPPLRSQPSYDTSWQRDHDDFGTSDDEYDYGQDQEDEEDLEEEPASAIVVAEEGRGLIVHGENAPVNSLAIPIGTTHLLVGGSSTPNAVPSFLTAYLPQISTSLLALDISANFLASLSPALASCSCLEELNISANPLRALPEFLSQLTSLRVLLADSTGISTIPGPLSALDKLHTLSIRRNKMHALPSWLCTLPCLESLLVDGNPFQGPWKALVEPLLAKTPMTPAYPPSTPMLSQLSAVPSSITSNATTTVNTDNSDTEESTDQDEPPSSSISNQPVLNGLTTTTTVSHPLLPALPLTDPATDVSTTSASASDSNPEDDTITPAHARQLGRSVTSPAASPSFSPSHPSRPLSRTLTAPNRGYHNRERRSRTENVYNPNQIDATRGSLIAAALPVATSISEGYEGLTDDAGNSLNANTNASDPDSLEMQRLKEHGELRRMRSADELRRYTQTQTQTPAEGSGTPYASSSSSMLSPPGSPPRPKLPSYFSSSSPSVAETPDAQRRFASMSVHSRSASRASIRPLAQALWGSGTQTEADDADVDSPPRQMSRARASTALSISRRSNSKEENHPNQVQGKKEKASKGEKEKSGKKWGFLKKMSMGKLRPGEESSSSRSGTPAPGASSSSLSLSRPSAAQMLSRQGNLSRPSMPASSTASSFSSATSRKLSMPDTSEDLPLSATQSTSSFPISSPPSSANPSMTLFPSNASTDKLKPGTPLTPSSANFLAPPSPMSKSSKRRSFLPIDGPPALNIPIPSSSPFLGRNDMQEEEDVKLASPTKESPLDTQRREDERDREANARALRSVMAYLKDMNDLTLLSQGSVLSMYGGNAPASISTLGSASAASPSPVPLMDRSRRPTLVDGQRLPSETSIDSMDTASSAPTTASSHLRSLDSLSGDRSTSMNTMSIATSDSSGSGEERKAKDDRGKRIMIVREIVETERTYVKNLQELVDIYVRPSAIPVNSLGNVTASSKETVVPQAERKIVFGGLDALFTFHKESFFPALEAAAAPLLSPQGSAKDADCDGRLSAEVAMDVGRTFVSHAAFMKMYSSYINNFENSVTRIRQWVSDRPSPGGTLSPSASSAHLAAGVAMSMGSTAAQNLAGDPSTKVNLTASQRKRIKQYLKRCRLNPRHSQLNLEGYLLLPVQRIPRYRLLLEDLTRSTPPPDSYDDPLERALTEISSLATNMNEGKRDAESRRKLVQWQARIRGKFPSPLVQPHRRLIMDGKLVLTRIVRKQTMAFEVLDSHGDTANVAVDCLAPELTPRPLYGVLCNDLFVLCRDPSNGLDPHSPVDLWAVLRMQTMPQPTSIVHGNTLRIVDTKAILYLEAPSTSEALTWFRAINMHVPAQRPEAI